MLDIVLAGGDVIDGTSGQRRQADVGIDDGQITAICDLSAAERRTTIECSRLVVCPGFIDIHTHSDEACLSGGESISKIMQGVTTEIVGHCGSSPAPLSARVMAEKAGEFARYQVTPSWTTVAGYLDAVDAAAPALNIGTLVGHGNLRLGVIGPDSRPAGPADIDAMCGLLAQGLEQGAFGLSTGLYYAPGCFSSPGEIERLAAVVSSSDRLYSTHIRGETTSLDRSLDEAVVTAERSGVRLQISHLKAAGKMNWGRMPAILDRLEMSARNIDLNCDAYPYTAGHTSLGSLLPPWALAGGEERLIARIADPLLRARIKTELDGCDPSWDNMARAAGWDRIIIARPAGDGRDEIVGRSLAELASDANAEPPEVLLDLVSDGQATAKIIIFMMDERDVRAVIAWKRAAIGSDASSVTPGGPGTASGRPHPRAFGTFARVLGRYTGDNFPLEQAVRKMTSLPADILRLSGRGRLSPGYAADVTVFDPELILDNASYDDPMQTAQGIRWVLTNGIPVVAAGVPTGRRPGRSLRAH